MISPTLRTAVKKTKGVELTDTFDEATQDKLALGIAMNNKAIANYVNGTGNIEDALDGLGAVWESFKNDRAGGQELLERLKNAEDVRS